MSNVIKKEELCPTTKAFVMLKEDFANITKKDLAETQEAAEKLADELDKRYMERCKKLSEDLLNVLVCSTSDCIEGMIDLAEKVQESGTEEEKDILEKRDINMMKAVLKVRQFEDEDIDKNPLGAIHVLSEIIELLGGKVKGAVIVEDKDK